MVEALLRAEGHEFEPEPFSPWCRRAVRENRPLGGSLAATFGLIYIQDRSSMLPPLGLNPPEGASVLDMCASPGSKTGFLSQLVGRDGFVLGNEPGRERLANLRRNLQSINATNTATCNHDGSRLPLTNEGWDYIQLDPPCSGWGTVEKNRNVLDMWKNDKLIPLEDLQRNLLAEAWRLLKPGGRVLYSTCTTNVTENERQVLRAVERHGYEILPLDPFAGFVFEAPAMEGAEGTLRVDMERSDAQGFYLALLRKPDDAEAPPEESALKKAALQRDDPVEKGTAVDTDYFLDGAEALWENLPEGDMYRFGDTIYLLQEEALRLRTRGLRWAGFPLGKAGRGGARLSPRLRHLLPEWAPGANGLNVENVDDLRRLLSGQTVDTEGVRGKIAGLWYQGLRLGWVRVKGKRALWAGR